MRYFISIILAVFVLSNTALAGKYTSLISTQAALISLEMEQKPEPDPEPPPDTGAVPIVISPPPAVDDGCADGTCNNPPKKVYNPPAKRRGLFRR